MLEFGAPRADAGVLRRETEPAGGRMGHSRETEGGEEGGPQSVASCRVRPRERARSRAPGRSVDTKIFSASFCASIWSKKEETSASQLVSLFCSACLACSNVSKTMFTLRQNPLFWGLRQLAAQVVVQAGPGMYPVAVQRVLMAGSDCYRRSAHS